MIYFSKASIKISAKTLAVVGSVFLVSACADLKITGDENFVTVKDIYTLDAPNLMPIAEQHCARWNKVPKLTGLEEWTRVGFKKMEKTYQCVDK